MTLFRTMLFAATAVAASAAVPAQAQVAGIATADSTDAIMQAKAFSQAYQTIGTHLHLQCAVDPDQAQGNQRYQRPA